MHDRRREQHHRAHQQIGGEGESSSSQQVLASLVAEWPANRPIEIWNGIPGLTPVKSSGIASWLSAGTGKLAAQAKPDKAAKGKPAELAASPQRPATAARRPNSWGLLQRGATLAQIMKATGWQAHSVRGFISGGLGMEKA